LKTWNTFGNQKNYQVRLNSNSLETLGENKKIERIFCATKNIKN